MTRREKTIAYLKLTGFDTTFDAVIAETTGTFRNGFTEGLGEALPDDAAQALTVVEEALRSRKDALLGELAGIYEGYLTEDEIGTLLAFQKSDVGQKANRIGRDVVNATLEVTEAWRNKAVRSVEPELQQLLGDEPPSAPIASAR